MDRPNWCLKCELEGIEPYGDFLNCTTHGPLTLADMFALTPDIAALRQSKVPDNHPTKRRGGQDHG